jgi:hypothetical protein
MSAPEQNYANPDRRNIKRVGTTNLSDVLLGGVKMTDPVRLALLQPLLQVSLLVQQLTHRLRHTAVGRQVSNQS